MCTRDQRLYFLLAHTRYCSWCWNKHDICALSGKGGDVTFTDNCAAAFPHNPCAVHFTGDDNGLVANGLTNRFHRFSQSEIANAVVGISRQYQDLRSHFYQFASILCGCGTAWFHLPDVIMRTGKFRIDGLKVDAYDASGQALQFMQRLIRCSTGRHSLD